MTAPSDAGVRRSFDLILTLLACALGLAWSAPAVSHGGVSMEEDTCVMLVGPYKAHFTGYQPSVRASQEFCEDIPVVADAVIVLDFIDAPLREMEVDFRVVRDVNDIGVTATYDDLGGEAAIEAATEFYEPPKRYPRGNVNVTLGFTAPGNFIGVVTADDQATAQRHVSVFPFAVGMAPWYAGWGWIAIIVVVGVLLYLRPWARRRQAESPTASP
ncbi:MAG: hypothetical protein ACU85V_09630 [Gammaproteobacteria bacterium]